MNPGITNQPALTVSHDRVDHCWLKSEFVYTIQIFNLEIWRERILTHINIHAVVVIDSSLVPSSNITHCFN